MSPHLQKRLAQRGSTGYAGLLPGEPRVTQSQQALALTERYLLPHLPALEVFFLHVRHSVDDSLRTAQPVKLGKPYPLGQCLEISLAVEKTLKTLDPAALPDNAVAGYRALAAFFNAGGTMRRVWGDLRGKFFQNAFAVGTLYVDVSNDTVTPTKPKVEILPFEESGMSPIQDYAHFAQIAGVYWQSRCIPNHVLPDLAPYCPLFTISPQGVVQLQSPANYLVSLNLTQQFQPAQAYLDQPPMAQDIHAFVASMIGTLGLAAAAPDPDAGRLAALARCRRYREKRWHQQLERRDTVFQEVAKINRALRRVRLSDAGSFFQAVTGLPVVLGQTKASVQAIALHPLDPAGSPDKPVRRWVALRPVTLGIPDTAAQRVFQALHQSGVLSPFTPGAPHTLVNPAGWPLYCVNEKQLHRMPAAELARLHRASALPVAYAQLLSLQHLHHL